MNRESFDPSARAFLDAAEREVFRTRSVLTMSQMSIAAIVDAAGSGLTRGAFTHHWPRRIDFERDLAAFIAAGVRDRAADRLELNMADLVGHATELPDLDTLLRAGTAAIVDSIASSDDMPIIIGLWAIGITDERVRTALATSWRTAGEGLHETVRLLLAVYRRRVRADTSIDVLARTLSTTMTGNAVRLLVMGPEDDYGVDVWTTNVKALILDRTEPIDAAGD